MDEQSGKQAPGEAQANNPVHSCLSTRIVGEQALEGLEASCLVKIMIAGMDFPGFLSAEIVPPYPPEHNEWRLLQRFRQAQQVTAWRNSEKHTQLIRELQATLPPNASMSIVDEELAEGERGSVATAIVTEVKSGMATSYREWEGRVQIAQAKFAGYRGSYVQPPTSDEHPQWTTMLRFETPETLENWFNCAERKALLSEGSQYVARVDYQQLTNGFPGWFPTDPKTGKGPAIYKTFMLVLVGLFPIVMLEIKYLNPLLTGLNAAPANFLGNVLSVAATTWITVPALIKAFSWWILPPDDPAKESTEIKGILILLAIYSAEIALLWKLF